MDPKRIILVVFCLLAATTANGFQSRQSSRPTGYSVIKGRVIFADTGRPARRISIHLFKDLNHPAIRTTVSTIRGEFRFAGVVAGSYFVVPVGSGIVSHQSVYEINEFGLGTGGFQPTQVAVDGKNEKRCEVQAVRGASISGIITYSDKEPVKEGRITLFHRNGEAIAPIFTSHGPTDDRGMFRVDGLPAGDYFVGISDRRPPFDSPAPISTSYYPGVSNFTDAKPIHLEAGANVNNINMTLGEDRLRKISGVVKWRHTGQPVSGAVVTLRRKDEPKAGVGYGELISMISSHDPDVDYPPLRNLGLVMLTAPTLTEVEENGTWKFEDLPPAVYLIIAYVPFPPEAQANELSRDEAPNPSESVESVANEQMVSSQIELTVGEEDLKDVVIDVSEGGRISGVVDGEESANEKLFVSFRSKDSLELLSTMSAQAIAASGPFTLNGISSGELQVDVEIPVNSSLYVKSITAGSRDLMRETLRVDDNTELTGVRISLGKGMATLSGTVVLKDGTPAAGNRVLLLRADPKLWHLRASRLFAMTNQAGEFAVRAAPGEYMAFAWPSANQSPPTIEAFVRSQAATARRVTLQPNDEQKIELTVSPREK